MQQLNDLRVFEQARENLRYIANLTQKPSIFGDLHNQLQRAAISVVSNIAEGAGSGTNKQFIRFLRIARGSNSEIHAQLLIMKDLGTKTIDDDVINKITYTGKMLSNLIKYLSTT